MSMPSVFTSLAGASQDTLEQVLAEREFRRAQAMQAAEAQRKMQMEDARLGLQVAAARRADDALDLSKRTAAEVQRDRELRREREDAQAREAKNKGGIAEMAIDGLVQGTLDMPNARAMAVRAGLPMNSFILPEPPETPEARRARLRDDEIARAEGRAEADRRFPKPQATRVAKDNPAAPRGVVDAIRAAKGSPGWETVDAAMASLSKHWQQFAADHPSMTLAAMQAKLRDIYGTRPKSSRDADSAFDPE